MDITPPKSDKGIQQLRETNRNGAVKQTDAITPYAPIESSETHHENGSKPPVERRMWQRRKEERRQEESNRPFDTRSGMERRKGDRRRSDDQETEQTAPRSGVPHIDEKV